jgi:hypothetical protein
MHGDDSYVLEQDHLFTFKFPTRERIGTSVPFVRG